MDVKKPLVYMVELGEGVEKLDKDNRSTHMENVKKWCASDGKSMLRRVMFHEKLDYYAYTGYFTDDVIKQIEGDSKMVTAVNSGRPLNKSDHSVMTSTAGSWWLADIAPVPKVLPDGKKVLPDNVEPVAVWYSPQTQGQGVDIYIVDEGFGDLQKDNDLQHRVERLWPGKSEGEPKPDPREDPELQAKDFHGYYVARLASGGLTSAAPKSNLYWISYLQNDIDNAASSIGALEALSEVWTSIEKKGGIRTSIINCSWGVYLHLTQRDVVARLCELIAKKVVFVAACGNEGKPMQEVKPVPAWLPETISVGCTQKVLQTFGDPDSVADFSNYGERVDIYAPGKGIRLNDNHGIPINVPPLDGTSFSAPIVAGAIACILSGALAEKERRGDKSTPPNDKQPTPSAIKELLHVKGVDIPSFTREGQKPTSVKKLVLQPFPATEPPPEPPKTTAPQTSKQQQMADFPERDDDEWKD